MAGLAPKSTAATKDTTDDDQCSWGCGRLSQACGSRLGEPVRDSGVKGRRGSRMGPICDVLSVGDLLPPFGMAEDCRGDSWTSLFLPGSLPRESNLGRVPDQLGSEPNFR